MSHLIRIMVRCPTTGKALDTGIKTSGRQALNNNAFRDGKVRCRYCQQFHPLDKDAFCEVDVAEHVGGLWRPNP